MVNLGALSRHVFISLVMASLVLASVPDSDAGTKITGLVKSIYCLLTGVFPLLIFSLMVLAAVAYGAGQMFGADTRAKASTWAMACLTGAVIALVIYMLGPMIINGLYGTTTAPTAHSAFRIAETAR